MGREWFGIGLAIVMFLGALLVLYFIFFRRMWKHDEFDERQRIARGRAAKISLVATFVYLGLYAILDFCGICWFPVWMGCSFAIVLGGTVFAISAIVQSAWLRPMEKVGSFLFTGSIYLALWIMELGKGLLRERFVKNGMLTAEAFSVLLHFHVLLIFAVLLIQVAWQKQRDKKEEREEQ